MRRNNIELRKCDGNNRKFEIVKWQDNWYFGRENEYPILENGMRRKTEKASLPIPETLFNLSQTYCVIAFCEDGIPEFVGDRFMELDKNQDIFDFVWLLRETIILKSTQNGNTNVYSAMPDIRS